MAMIELLIEKVKRFWDSRPCNIRHSNAPLGTKKYFDEVAARRYFVEAHIPVFADFPRWHDKKVLEVGCGIGTDTVQFTRAGAQVTAVDLSPRSLEIATHQFDVYGLNGSFFCANAEELSNAVPVAPYDLIYSFGVIHHTPNPERVIEEIKKYCHPETELRLMLYAKWSWKLLWIITKFGRGRFWQWRKLLAHYSEAQEGSPVTYAYSGREVRKILDRHGFKAVSLKKTFIFPYEIASYRKYQYKKVWYFRYWPQWLFQKLESLLGWHLLIVAKPKRPEL